MLRGDLFKQADEWWSYVVDVIIVTLIAILFATNQPPFKRWLSIVTAAGGLLVVEYIAWQNLGLLFDCTVPVLALFIHRIYDEYRHMRERLKELEELYRRAE